MAAKKKPEPISKFIVCSECGLDWGKHSETPSLEDCVRLLKAELAARPRQWAQVAGTAIQWTPARPQNTC